MRTSQRSTDTRTSVARGDPNGETSAGIATRASGRSHVAPDAAAALDARATAILIIGQGDRLVHANAADRALIEGGDLLAQRDGTIRPWDRAGAAAFQALVEAGRTMSDSAAATVATRSRRGCR
ncbi:hypothetical protein [Methylobacterium frigidaeris]|uniref:Uncharacterized protein n=1 Tax=Methylobacterium frigidaeris TaxID=2038277 RepID=A0AA37M4W8_9HYPH|nr:hypothetical protein [Methylobacterium frigidaeris]PIK70677.1 hypothetical protein CS379_23400 [Methylobacterium frigidaeris]GJD62948.1 hypothetical protein MPEAHAMD_3109 [Methylobacterium frigidaeris]